MNQSDISLVNFPAIIKLHLDNELILMTTMSDFEHNIDITHMHFQPDDKLIDKYGRIFKIDNTAQLTLTATSDFMPIGLVIELIQLHFSNDGACCVSKFSAQTIEEALNCL